MLIAAASGRALAASARRGGYVPLVADAFGDQDTLAVAGAHTHADLLNRPVDAEKVIGALTRLSAGCDPAGLVWGSGFEDRADLLARIGARWKLFGNAAETVARLKDPLAFAAICCAADIPHPETSRAPPTDRSGWLVKRVGGAGGLHVRDARASKAAGEEVYFQRRVDGEPVSALVLADGRRAVVLGFSSQWAAPSRRHPFRYGGAVRPAMLPVGTQQAMTAAVQRLMTEVPLVGLNSADFLVCGDGYHLLEINPRPGATVDLFEPEGMSLFALHVEACAGKLPPQSLTFEGAVAAAIVYAAHDIDPVPSVKWPQWAADLPVAGSAISADGPLCSVFARAETPQEAKELARQRIAQVHALAAEWHA